MKKIDLLQCTRCFNLCKDIDRVLMPSGDGISKVHCCPVCINEIFTKAKPLFIPLKTKYYEAFCDGTKSIEYRRPKDNFHPKKCLPGRQVTISKGYGKQHRQNGVIKSAILIDAKTLPEDKQTDVLAVYGDIDIKIIAIEIVLDKFNNAGAA